MDRKKLLTFGLFGLFALALISAAVIFHFVNVDATVNEALSSTTFNLDLSGLPGETITESVSVSNGASVDLPVLLTWSESSNKYSLDNIGGTCPGTTCEKRIVVEQSDLGLTNLSELNEISWDVEVFTGYLPHVDVFLDNGETLTFEYAKVDPNQCDDAPYPTGVLNTFDDKGIVNDSAYAWESIPGACGDVEFDEQHKSLADWKAEYPNATIEKIEVEVDNWIAESNSDVWEIVVNGNVVADGVSYTVTLPEPNPTEVLANQITDIPVSFTYTTDTEPGKVSGHITLERV